jgi:hypothetical protein
VEQQSIDGQLRAPLLTDSNRWRRAIFDFPTRVTFQRIDDSFARYGASINAKNKSLVITDDQDKKPTSPSSVRPRIKMTLDGNMDGHTVHMQLKLTDRNQFLLVNRGFHRIQEYSSNR